jgi:two-component system OmpR family sensor kinase
MALSYYTEPFTQEQKKSDGFGLGLYIVQSILDLHQYKFSHYYKYGQNIFVIGLDT